MRDISRDIRLVKRMNWFMTVAVCALLAIGVLFVYSACFISEEQTVQSFYKKQIMWIAVGMLCYMMFAVADYRRLTKLSWWLYGVCAFLLVTVLFVGIPINGARRWLILFGLRMQPSELTKLATIIVLARTLSRPRVDFGSAKTLAMVLAIVAVPMLLIIKEPDLGTAMIFLPVMLIMMFAAGVHLKTLSVLVGSGLIAVGILVCMLIVSKEPELSEETKQNTSRIIHLPELSEKTRQNILKFTGLSEYQRERIMVFLGLTKDPLGAGWNKRQSEIAVGSGGKWGKGFLKGDQNVLGFLPRQVAPTDFIYSVIAEEKGFFGSLVVLLLFSLVVACGVQAALMAPDKIGRLLCIGITAMFFCHVLINIAMTVGLMPITGLPLPLLSYGGSFMVVTMSALGIVQSVYIRSRRRG